MKSNNSISKFAWLDRLIKHVLGGDDETLISKSSFDESFEFPNNVQFILMHKNGR